MPRDASLSDSQYGFSQSELAGFLPSISHSAAMDYEWWNISALISSALFLCHAQRICLLILFTLEGI